MGNYPTCCDPTDASSAHFVVAASSVAAAKSGNLRPSAVYAQNSRFTRRDRYALRIQKSWRGEFARRRIAIRLGRRPVCVTLRHVFGLFADGTAAGWGGGNGNDNEASLVTALRTVVARMGDTDAFALVTAHDRQSGQVLCTRRTEVMRTAGGAICWGGGGGSSGGADAGAGAEEGSGGRQVWLTGVPYDAEIVVSICGKSMLGRDAILAQASFELELCKTVLARGSSMELPLWPGDSWDLAGWDARAPAAGGNGAGGGALARGASFGRGGGGNGVGTRGGALLASEYAEKEGGGGGNGGSGPNGGGGRLALAVSGLPLWQSRCGLLSRWVVQRTFLGEQGAWHREWTTLSDRFYFHSSAAAEQPDCVIDFIDVVAIEQEDDRKIKVALQRAQRGSNNEQLLLEADTDEDLEAWLAALRWAVLKMQLNLDPTKC